MSDTKPLLSVRNLQTSFFQDEGVTKAVDGASFDVYPGRTLGIVRAHQQEAPEAILDALFDAVGDFSGQQLRDDITAVIIKAEGGA